MNHLEGIEIGARVRVRLTSLIGRTVAWEGVIVGEVDDGFVSVRDVSDGSIETVPVSRLEILEEGSTDEASS